LGQGGRLEGVAPTRERRAGEVVQPFEPLLDPEVEARCEERHQQACAHVAAGFYHWLEAGRLHAANKAELGTRNWAPWCRKHDTSVYGADHLILIANRFRPILDPGSRIAPWQIDFQALRALALPSASVAAAEEAMKRAEAGERITLAKAREIMAEEVDAEIAAAVDKVRKSAEEKAASESAAATHRVLPLGPTAHDEPQGSADARAAGRTITPIFNPTVPGRGLRGLDDLVEADDDLPAGPIPGCPPPWPAAIPSAILR
jgi:hypothetical protein